MRGCGGGGGGGGEKTKEMKCMDWTGALWSFVVSLKKGITNTHYTSPVDS